IDAGGARETIIDGHTGVLVRPDDPGALARALRHDFTHFDPREARANAERFSREAVQARLRAVVQAVRGGWLRRGGPDEQPVVPELLAGAVVTQRRFERVKREAFVLERAKDGAEARLAVVESRHRQLRLDDVDADERAYRAAQHAQLVALHVELQNRRAR